MGIIRLNCEVAHPADATRSIRFENALIDTGAELSWLPGERLRRIGIVPVKVNVAFQMANGQAIVRSIGYGILRAAGFETIDEVVFGEAGDLTLLGARTLEGFGATIDPVHKRLVAAGPHLAAGGARTPGGYAAAVGLNPSGREYRASLAGTP